MSTARVPQKVPRFGRTFVYDTLNAMTKTCAVEHCESTPLTVTGGRPSLRCADHATTCVVSGCENSTTTTIRCRKHHARFKRTGSDRLQCFCDEDGVPCPEHKTHGYGEAGTRYRRRTHVPTAYRVPPVARTN